MKNAQSKKPSSSPLKKVLQPPPHRPVGKIARGLTAKDREPTIAKFRGTPQPPVKKAVKKAPVPSAPKRTVARPGSGPAKKVGQKQSESKMEAVVSVSGVLLTEKSHAKHGPSSLPNKEICPGFVSRPGSSKASEEGTLLHKFMEDWGREYHATGNMETADLAGRFNGLTTEQQEVIVSLKSVVQPLLDEYRLGEVFFEYELDLSVLQLLECEHGTADILLIDHDRFCVVDYKFGKHEVEDPQENVQFHAYVLGAFWKCPNVMTGDVLCLQPRCDVIGNATFVREDISRMVLRITTIVERSEIVSGAGLDSYITVPTGSPLMAPILNPRLNLCEWCGNVGKCPAVAKFALMVSGGPPLEIPSPVAPMPDSDSEHLGQLATWAKLLEAKAKGMLADLVTLAGAGHDIEGFTLVNSSGKRLLIDPMGLAKELKKQCGLTTDQVLSCAQLGTEKLEELVVKRATPDRKVEAKQEFRQLISSGGFWSSGQPSSYLKKS